MPEKGEKYQHKQINDITYTVTKVVPRRSAVYLDPGNIEITFSQLIENYKKVN